MIGPGCGAVLSGVLGGGWVKGGGYGGVRGPLRSIFA